MSNTISTKFDKSALPHWAQRNAKVVELCKRDLAYRANVCRAANVSANDPYRKALVKEAEQRER